MTDRDSAPGRRDTIEPAGLAPAAVIAGGLPSAPMLWAAHGFLCRPDAAGT